MPTKPFTGTASYYKILPLPGPTPLLQNAVGVFVGTSMANVGSLQKGRRSAKNVAFFDLLFCLVHFKEHICCLMNFDYNRRYWLVLIFSASAVVSPENK